MFANSRLTVTKVIGQRKAFYRQRIPESSCLRKETVYIDILVTLDIDILVDIEILVFIIAAFSNRSFFG